mmetsp:Transcript_19757/g.22738  ORF Transcript_19757/g.22738 Transcript_19757/m.22738 type:complete len:148 (-) Transcript_19757:190-633(-)
MLLLLNCTHLKIFSRSLVNDNLLLCFRQKYSTQDTFVDELGDRVSAGVFSPLSLSSNANCEEKNRALLSHFSFCFPPFQLNSQRYTSFNDNAAINARVYIFVTDRRATQKTIKNQNLERGWRGKRNKERSNMYVCGAKSHGETVKRR